MTIAFRGTYSDWRLVKTRGVIQIVFEVPLTDADRAYDVLGGMPDASRERWFGIAAIRGEEVVGREFEQTAARPEDCEQLPRAKRSWQDLSPQQQAGIRCEEPSFIVFLQEEHPDYFHEAMTDPAECVRMICGVESRAELETNQKARVIWKQLSDQFDAWRALEHA